MSSAGVVPNCPPMAPIVEFPSPALTAEQYRAIELLLSGHTPAKTVQILNIGRRTLFRWRQNPIFQAEFNRRQLELVEASDRRLRNLTEKAVSVIERHLDENSLLAATSLLKIVQGLAKLNAETDPQAILKREIEQHMRSFLYAAPFSEKNPGQHMLDNKAFLGLTKDIYDHQARKYGLTEGPVDEIIEEIQQQE